jgi:hypothetical protein
MNYLCPSRLQLVAQSIVLTLGDLEIRLMMKSQVAPT